MKVIKIILVIWIAICVLSLASYVKALVYGEKINENLELRREACKYKDGSIYIPDNETAIECIERYQLEIDGKLKIEGNR